mmetsp:Transcript_30213/g.96276  ORF Transcript_30213/g.96276 Transcript_30213/m.96276 type:complete len:189 (+) Transcript_30213:1364-1930(+)
MNTDRSTLGQRRDVARGMRKAVSFGVEQGEALAANGLPPNICGISDSEKNPPLNRAATCAAGSSAVASSGFPVAEVWRAAAPPMPPDTVLPKSPRIYNRSLTGFTDPTGPMSFSNAAMVCLAENRFKTRRSQQEQVAISGWLTPMPFERIISGGRMADSPNYERLGKDTCQADETCSSVSPGLDCDNV